MKVIIVIPFLVVLIDLSKAQLSLPEMPGPPYPDRFGNNRWGVKYDPNVHGRGRGRQHSSSSSAGAYGVEYSPSLGYHGGGGRAPPTRSKWTSALKLVSRSRLSKSKSRRNRPKSSTTFDPTSDSFYKNAYSSKAIDGYVKNYLNTYNRVAQTPPVSSSDLVNIQSFSRPTSLNGGFRPRNFVSRSDNRRSFTSDSSSSRSDTSSSLKDIYAGLSDSKASYRTLNPQVDFFGPKIDKKKSDFAKTLSNIYNDYKPGGENADSGISSGNSASSSSSSGSIFGVAETAATDAHSNAVAAQDDDYPPSYSSLPPPRSPSSRRQSRPRPPPSSGGPTYVERPYYSSGSGKRPRGPPPYSSRGPPPPPPRSSYSSRPLSSIDMFDDIPSYSSGGPFSSGPHDIEYSSDSPMIITSSDGGDSFSSLGPNSFSSSSSGPVTVSSYTMSGPPPSSSRYSSPFDSFGPSGPGHFSPPTGSFSGPPPPSPYNDSPFAPHGGPPPPSPYNDSPFAPPHGGPPPPPPHGIAPGAPPLSYLAPSGLYYPPALIPRPQSDNFDDDKPKKSKKSKPKRKKKRLQHTPMNVLRGLLGRNERRDRQRERDHEDEEDRIRDRERERERSRDRETYKSSYAANYPIALPPPIVPPQYVISPLVNSIAAPLDYGPPLQPIQPLYAGLPPPPPPPPFSPLLSGIANLRDNLIGYRERPYRHPRPPPPPPPPPRYQSSSQEVSSAKDTPPPPPPVEIKKEASAAPIRPPPGPITQHLQDWPRIFTAMGSSVDAVAGGIHAVRKEISKMTGQTMAKGILMGGTAVHEVTKGVAHVITKMSSI